MEIVISVSWVLTLVVVIDVELHRVSFQRPSCLSCHLSDRVTRGNKNLLFRDKQGIIFDILADKFGERKEGKDSFAADNSSWHNHCGKSQKLLFLPFFAFILSLYSIARPSSLREFPSRSLSLPKKDWNGKKCCLCLPIFLLKIDGRLWQNFPPEMLWKFMYPN